MWSGDVPRSSRELVAAAVSRFNSCNYWTDAHEANLQAAGGDAKRVAKLMDGAAENETTLERELIFLARKPTQSVGIRVLREIWLSDLDPLGDSSGALHPQNDK